VAILGACTACLASRRRKTLVQKLPWLLLCGFSAGFALGTKYTGLTAMGLVGAGFLREWWRVRSAKTLTQTVTQLGIVFTVFIAIYLVGWYIHFNLPWFAGPGDAFYVPKGDFFHDFFEQQRLMLSSNNGITAVHHDSSQWWSWPLMMIPVYYWLKDSSFIDFLGNPVVWWGGALLFVVGVFAEIFRRTTQVSLSMHRSSVDTWFPFIGYWMAFLPYTGVSRPLFLYHYLPPLLFCTVCVTLWLERWGWTRAGSIKVQRRSYWIVCALCFFGFSLMLPFTSGWPFGAEFRNLIFLLFPLWR